MKEIRIDTITNDIIIVAKDRSNRPIDKILNKEEIEVLNEYDSKCPFCRGNEDSSETEKFKITDKNDWLVRSVDNKFPIVDDLSNQIYGQHEVMIDTYRHNGNFYNMNKDEYINLFKMYQNRYKELIKDENIEYISIFKNFLRKSGASLTHPHSQILSLSIIPPDIEKEIEIAKKYYDKNNTCLYKDTIKDEIEYGKRVIYNGEEFLLIIPYATKYSGEVRVLFKEKIRFENLDNHHIEELSYIFENLFKNLYAERGYCPFNIYIHTYPKNIECDMYFNTHIHIVPRKFSFGGFELSTGMYVSSINEEEFANKLRF